MRASTAVLFALVLTFCVLAEPAEDNALPARLAADEYNIVIDAGSSGCRVHVFKLTWSGRADGLPDVDWPAHTKKKINPGLSSFEDNPAAAGASLEPLIKFAIAEIPPEKRASTTVRLAATAGLRCIRIPR
jgi:Golgi nucleoside diphosphatase